MNKAQDHGPNARSYSLMNLDTQKGLNLFISTTWCEPRVNLHFAAPIAKGFERCFVNHKDAMIFDRPFEEEVCDDCGGPLFEHDPNSDECPRLRHDEEMSRRILEEDDDEEDEDIAF